MAAETNHSATYASVTFKHLTAGDGVAKVDMVALHDTGEEPCDARRHFYGPAEPTGALRKGLDAHATCGQACSCSWPNQPSEGNRTERRQLHRSLWSSALDSPLNLSG